MYNIAEISAVGRGYCAVLDNKKAQNTDDCNNNADDSKDDCPALEFVQIKEHKTAKNKEHRYQRHH